MLLTQFKILFSRVQFWLILVSSIIVMIFFAFRANLTPLGDISNQFLYIGNGFSGDFSKYAAIYPFIIVVPFATSIIDDISTKTINNYCYRAKKYSYILSKYIVGFVANFLIVFIPFLVNWEICINRYKSNSVNPFGDENMDNNLKNTIYGTNLDFKILNRKIFFADTYYKNTTLFYMKYLILFATFTGLICVFLLALSTWIKKYRIVLFLPIYLLMQMCTTVTSISLNKAIHDNKHVFVNYKLLDYFTPFSYGGSSSLYLTIFAIFIIAFSIISMIRFSRKDITYYAK